MGFFDKVKKIVNVNESDYYDGVDDMDEDYDDAVYEEEDDVDEPAVAPKPSFSGFRSSEKSNAKVVDINSTPSRARPKVVFAKPASFDESLSIADQINSKHMVILNLESTSRDVSRRFVDFLGGVAYANGGAMKRVAAGTFLISPKGYDFSGEDMDEFGLGSFFS